MSLWTRDSWKTKRKKVIMDSTTPQDGHADPRAVAMLCDRLTVGVCSLEDKRDWMEPAIVSHVARLLKVSDDDVRFVVGRWFDEKCDPPGW